MDAKPKAKSIVDFEDVGAIGTEGFGEILEKPSKKETLSELETPVSAVPVMKPEPAYPVLTPEPTSTIVDSPPRKTSIVQMENIKAIEEGQKALARERMEGRAPSRATTPRPISRFAPPSLSRMTKAQLEVLYRTLVPDVALSTSITKDQLIEDIKFLQSGSGGELSGFISPLRRPSQVRGRVEELVASPPPVRSPPSIPIQPSPPPQSAIASAVGAPEEQPPVVAARKKSSSKTPSAKKSSSKKDPVFKSTTQLDVNRFFGTPSNP